MVSDIRRHHHINCAMVFFAICVLLAKLKSISLSKLSSIFALRSGSEHRRLRYTPAQIQLIEKSHSCPYLIYQEDISKTNQGGLHSRTKQPKKVIHYANTTNPDRCFIHIYNTYMSKCPSDRPAGAFYLQPLQKPKGDVWFSKVPCGHNTSQKIVPELMKAAGISGYFTNHSLRASAATRLFEGGVDEQLIMSRTGHSSREGVRAYKRTTTKLSEGTEWSTIMGLKEKQVYLHQIWAHYQRR